jgi:hypothetical protein
MTCNRHPRHAESPLKHLARNPFGALPPDVGERLRQWRESPAVDGPFRGSSGEWRAWIPADGDPVSGEQLTEFDAEDPGVAAVRLMDTLEDRLGPPG